MEETTSPPPPRKTRSLTLSPDPVSRMRELHDLDTPTVQTVGTPATQTPNGKPLTTVETGNAEIKKVSNIASGQEIKKALRDALKAPYPEGSIKGPLTTVTTRLPAEICQRLDWASSITSQKKQEVITEALRLYFERLANEED
jgi:hypothetical protein